MLVKKITDIFKEKNMKAEIEVLQDLIVRSMTLELARQANLLTRFNIEHFISKLRAWVKEEFNDDYVKMWDAFREGRRPL